MNTIRNFEKTFANRKRQQLFNFKNNGPDQNYQTTVYVSIVLCAATTTVDHVVCNVLVKN